MRLDGFGLFVQDMGTMIRFYRDVLGFEIQESEDAGNVYLVRTAPCSCSTGERILPGKTGKEYGYAQGLNGHGEIALYVDTFEEVDRAFAQVVAKGAAPVLEPVTQPWGQRTCYVADPEGNLIEIGSFNRPFGR